MLSNKRQSNDLTDISELLLCLLRVALGNEDSCEIPSGVNWENVMDFAESQGVSCVAFDGLQKVLSSASTDKKSIISMVDLMEWAGQTNRMEIVYKQYRSSLFEFIEVLSKHKINVILLKGYGCSLNYPKPEHRPCGDIDIYSHAYEDINRLMESVGIEVDYDSHHHSVFRFKGILIENHQMIFDARRCKSNVYVNEILDGLALRSLEMHRASINHAQYNVKLEDGKYLLPSVNFNSVHLLRHMASDFATVKTSLRQVIDWATFVSKHNVDWDFLHKVVHEANMNRFLDVLNGICVSRLGYSSELFPVEVRDRNLENKVMNEILTCTYTADNPSKDISLSGKITYGINKSIRMWMNRWKYKIVFDESLLDSFMWKARVRLLQ